jgi:hypothetical protein
VANCCVADDSTDLDGGPLWAGLTELDVYDRAQRVTRQLAATPTDCTRS